MPSEAIKKFFIVLMLGSLTASAFFIRLENFKNSPNRSIDEIVYYRMGKQVLSAGLSGYNTIPYARELTAQGRELPSYFFAPIFKYPPVFTFFIALSMKLFGTSLLSAAYIPLLTGALMIPLVYLLGSLLFTPLIGLCAAILLWQDPVNIISSQKVWMDSAMGFWTLLAVTLFISGVKKNRDILLILAGLTCGLAVLTRYTGILIEAIFVLYALMCRKDLFKRKNFYFTLLLPFVFLLPWWLWNLKIFGMDIVGLQLKMHPEILTRLKPEDYFVLMLFSVLILTLKRIYSKSFPVVGSFITWRSRFVLGAVILGCISRNLLASIDFPSLPFTTWARGLFAYGNQPFFYFGRLLEYSLLYLFAYINLFFYKKSTHEDPAAILRLSCAVLFIFFILWRNYQSRYILPVTPFLLILANAQILTFYQKASKLAHPWLRRLAVTGLTAVIFYALSKTAYINAALSFTNDFCYY